MALTYTFQERKDQRSARGSQSDVTLRRVYQLITTDSGLSSRISEAAAYAYVIAPVSPGPGAGFPIGSSHPDSSNAKLTSIDVQDGAEDGCQWEITLEWKTGLDGSAIPEPNPLDREPEVEWSQNLETVEIFKDFDATPRLIQPSSGEQFETLPNRERGTLSLQYTRNESETDFKTTILPVMAYDAVVNDDTFVIDGVTIPALYARLCLSATKMVEAGVTYYRVVYKISFRQGNDTGNLTDGWRERYLDRGYFESNGSGGLLPIRDDDGQLVSTPWPLDGSGAKAANVTDAPAVLPAPASDGFKLYPEIDFDVFDFA